MAAVKVRETPSRVYGGQTGDERAAVRRDALVAAAFSLVAEEGWRGVSIEAVCRRAALNKRYFYESFQGVDTLISAVTTWLADDAIEVTLAALDPELPRDESTAQAITAFVEHLTDDPRRARVLFGAVPADDAAAGLRAAAIRRLIAIVEEHGRSIYAVSDEDPAGELSAAMIIGGTSQAILDWLDGRAACPREELVDHLISLWLAIGDATDARASHHSPPKPASPLRRRGSPRR
jgi:AcrR family transcriptional regulator